MICDERCNEMWCDSTHVQKKSLNPSPILVYVGFMMLVLWPGEFIQAMEKTSSEDIDESYCMHQSAFVHEQSTGWSVSPIMTASGVCCPLATFSATPRH